MKKGSVSWSQLNFLEEEKITSMMIIRKMQNTKKGVNVLGFNFLWGGLLLGRHPKKKRKTALRRGNFGVGETSRWRTSERGPVELAD